MLESVDGTNYLSLRKLQLQRAVFIFVLFHLVIIFFCNVEKKVRCVELTWLGWDLIVWCRVDAPGDLESHFFASLFFWDEAESL